MLVIAALSPTHVHAAANPKEARFSHLGRRHRGRALVLGSSSINGVLGRVLTGGLRKAGYSVYRLGVSSSGLARPDYFDWLDRARSLPLPGPTAVAVVYMGGNDGQALRLRPGELRRSKRRWLPFSHRKWGRTYAARVAAFAKALCRRGVMQVVFLPPADVGKSRLQRALGQVRRGLRGGARKVRCATTARTGGDASAIRRFAASRRLRIRQPDAVHMTRAGAERLWRRVKRRVVGRARYGRRLIARRKARIAKKRRARLRAQARKRRKAEARKRRRARLERSRRGSIRKPRRHRRTRRRKGRSQRRR